MLYGRLRAHLWITWAVAFYYAGVLLVFCDTICRNPACQCDRLDSLNWIMATCNFSQYQDIILDANSMPPELGELTITGGQSLLVEDGTFSKLPFLQRILLDRIADTVTIQRHSFLNLSCGHLALEVRRCGTVVIRSRAFYLQLRGPVSVLVSSCERLVLENNFVSWMSNVTVKGVREVTLAQNAFSQDSVKMNRHAAFSEIRMSDVAIDEIPPNCFPSPVTQIHFENCTIGVLRSLAMCAVEVRSVSVRNCTVRVIEPAAFSDRTMITALNLSNAILHHVQNNALLSAINNMIVLNSHIGELLEEGLNMRAVASFELRNTTLGCVRARGITLRNWSNVKIENNTLIKMDKSAIDIAHHEQIIAGDKYNVKIVGNVLSDLQNNALTLRSDKNIFYEIFDNVFVKNCDCDFAYWLSNIIDSNDDVMKMYYNTSFCYVDIDTSNCVGKTNGFTFAAKFVESACDSGNRVPCHYSNNTLIPNPNIDKAIDLINGEIKTADEEKMILRALLIFGICGTLITGLISAILFIIRRKYVSSRKESQFANVFDKFSFAKNRTNLSRSTSTHSIRQMCAHEYSELRANKNNITPIINDVEEYVIYEDKMTQTLPEELTQELLHALRDKLDEPENYGEARTMIEHLYDLIKVEENCNNNSMDEYGATFDFDQPIDDVYDVIRTTNQRMRTKSRANKTYASVGTRAPSPDKLQPINLLHVGRVKVNCSIMDYSMPIDSVATAIYAEPDYTVPFSAEFGKRSLVEPDLLKRPLPQTPLQIDNDLKSSSTLV